MDEMGHQSWADAKQKTCFVPADADIDRISYPVSRSGKRITLIACIAADGSYMLPSLIIQRETFEDELLLMGFTPEKVELYTQKTSFIDRDIFFDWFKDSFIPEVQLRRARYEYSGPGVLIMDSCTAHAGDDFHALCVESGVELVLIPPHSSNQLQMLDLCVFGVTKRLIARTNKLEKCNVQTAHIVSILNGFNAAACPYTIGASFKNAGISLIMDDARTLRCQIRPHTARCLITSSALDARLPEVAEEEEDNPEEEDDPDEVAYSQHGDEFVFTPEPSQKRPKRYCRSFASLE
jgi:hypothetical protein